MQTFNAAQKVCIATLSYYYALSEMSLSSTEVWQWQMDEYGKVTYFPLGTLRAALRELSIGSIIRSENGFSALTEYPASVTERRWHMAETIRKRYLLAKRAAVLPYIPFVRLVRVLGSVAIGNARGTSDMDISIGVARGHLWLTRALVTAVAHVLGVRRWGSHTADRLCFNHYTCRSEAPYGSSTTAFFHIERQSIPLWSHASGSLSLGFSFKQIVERGSIVLGVATALEWILGELQRAKIYANTTPYPDALDAPSPHSNHLVFYYPRVASVQQRWQDILAFYQLGHFTQLGQNLVNL